MKEIKEKESPANGFYNLRHPHVDHGGALKKNKANGKEKNIKINSSPDGSDMIKLLWSTNLEKLKTDKEIFSTARKTTLLECFKV